MNTKTVKYEKFDAVDYYDAERPFKDHWSNPELDTKSIVLKKGTVCKEGAHPLTCDMIYDKDTPITLKDGTTIYVDIFRPTDTTKKYPCILAWLPYGKIDPPNHYGLYFNNSNLDPKHSCGLNTIEGPEPEYWVFHEYAVVVADSRGATNSEGDMRYFGYEESIDSSDTIEQLAAMDWCTGNVGMYGNSWLAICQYFAAAQQPPHLKCIAPWEGLSDMLRDCLMRGGIPTPEFVFGINSMMRYSNSIENVASMMMKYPYANPYWDEEKRPDFSKITVPAYFVGSWESNVHAYGTYRAWCKVASKEKWLRVHNTQEWFDINSPYYRNDLKKFYDHYLKEIDNGWENTPKVRMTLKDPTGTDLVNQVMEDFPNPKTGYRKMYLNAEDMSLSETAPEKEGTVSYHAQDGEGELVQFRVTVTKEMLLCGYFKMKLFMSTDAGDDLDIFAYVNKADDMGIGYSYKMLNVDFAGSEARLRASCRTIENAELFDFSHDFKNRKPVAPGEIVEMETIFWPQGLVIHEGEQLVFTVSSKNLRQIEFPAPPVRTVNQGNHTIYTGGKYASYVEIPVV